MRISQTGIDLIKEFESVELEAYVCPAGIWTIGYGHTGPDVHPGLTITHDEAESLLMQDLERFERAVLSYTSGLQLQQHQFDALVSFAFNVGTGNLKNSTLLKKLRANDAEGAAAEFLRWNKANGQVLPGLTRRREAESALFRG